MSERTDYSDELINAFVDDELKMEERAELLRAASRSETLRQRICDATYLKSMVQQAYPLAERPGQQPPRSADRRAFLTYAAAAAVGGMSVFAMLGLFKPTATVAPEGRVMAAAGGLTGKTDRVVFHISSAGLSPAEELLDQVELVLSIYASNRRPLKVEVVANNQGLRMLQLGRSQVVGRISRLDQTYPNLTFAACGNTLERFRRELKENIEIVPEAVIVQSGISFVARRQQEGWAYIKV